MFAGGNAPAEYVGNTELERFAHNKILFVGVDWERKGEPVLLEAFRRVRRTHPTAELIIVGCSPEGWVIAIAAPHSALVAARWLAIYSISGDTTWSIDANRAVNAAVCVATRSPDWRQEEGLNTQSSAPIGGCFAEGT